MNASPEDATSSKPRILIVDDVQANVQTLQLILQGDYEICVALSGKQALELMRDEPVDLVLLDVNMPRMDGYEVCSRIKSDLALRDVPVIFITANDSADDESRGFAAGCVDYIVKPYSALVVHARVRTHVTLKRQRDHLNTLLMHDSLTGIPNRKAFDDRLAREWARALRYQRPLGLLMIDIDHFKNLNDQGGHLYGDECLRLVARALTANHRRSSDFAARYAGDEFACLLPETTLEGTLAAGQNVHALVRSIEMPPASPGSRSLPPRLTISVGAAALVPTQGQSPASLIALADKHLYDAKNLGRDSVVSAQPLKDLLP